MNPIPGYVGLVGDWLRVPLSQVDALAMEDLILTLDLIYTHLINEQRGYDHLARSHKRR